MCSWAQDLDAFPPNAQPTLTTDEIERSIGKEQDEDGNWVLNGVKRFITNGCGEIVLTLARSEPHIADGRGLSLFISERSEHIKIRHLEKKLGIHGSPTCEMVYENAPARLVGERQRGLITYVLALMNVEDSPSAAHDLMATESGSDRLPARNATACLDWAGR